MSNDAQTPAPPAFSPPVSTLGGPTADLIAQQMIAPPARPGLLGTLNQFEIQRVLGSGGMGMVLLARDAFTGKSVAVKMIRSELVRDPQVVHRFVKEAGHLQKLKHPNVIPVLEVSDRPTGPYFVMPYYERGSLAQSIRPGHPLDAVLVLDIALDVAAGLQFAHRRGIIHRDLKPANILRTGEQTACLADFGLARTVFNDSIIDVEHQPVEGTAPYLSPGVAARHAEDTRCDIYAFGALLYEMLTGDPPYAGRTMQDIRRQILESPPKPIAERNPEADAGLRAVAEGAMARELRDRYADMTDVLADLQRIKEGREPVGPRGLVRSGLRQMRQVPTVVGILVVMGVALAVSGIFIHQMTLARQHQTASSAPLTNIPTAVFIGPVLPTNPLPVLVPKTIIAPSSPPALRWTATVLAGLAGTGSAADGLGAEARFQSPDGVAVDRFGNIYVADTGNDTVRKITPSGNVTTLAGQAGSHGSFDNRGSAARFWAPFGIAVDRGGNIFVAELANTCIRKITPTGIVSTLAGLAGIPGSADGLGDNAQFRNPSGVAVAADGVIYVADTSSSTIRKIAANGAVSTLAGRAGSYGYADGSGDQARFWDPHGLAVDGAGNIYVADTGNNVIRKITTNGVVSLLAGRPGSPGLADGAPSLSQLRRPQSLALDSAGRIFIADTDNQAIRLLTSAGLMTTLVVNGDLGHPDAVAADSQGNLYVADVMNNVIRKLTAADGAAH